MIQERHILLIGDDEQAVSELSQVLGEYHPEIKVKVVENSQQFDLAFGKKLPGLIILLFTSSSSRLISGLKKIREVKKLKEVPVFVYHDRPGKKEMEELLKEMQRDV